MTIGVSNWFMARNSLQAARGDSCAEDGAGSNFAYHFKDKSNCVFQYL